MNASHTIACIWTCVRCGHRGDFHQPPTVHDDKYVLADAPLCFSCYRTRYGEACGRWGVPSEALVGDDHVVTAPGRAALAADVIDLLNDPDRRIVALAISVAHRVWARVQFGTLELVFDLGSVPLVVIVGAPLPFTFVRDLATMVATDFAPLQRKARG